MYCDDLIKRIIIISDVGMKLKQNDLFFRIFTIYADAWAILDNTALQNNARSYLPFPKIRLTIIVQ